MASKSLAFVIWAAVAASIVYWLLALAGSSRPVPSHAVVVGDAIMAGDLSRLFGRATPVVAAPAAPPPSTQIKLLGVVAPRAGGDSRAALALISVEGKPARTYRIGSTIDADLVLQSVHQRGATLGPRDGAATMRLEMPPLATASTGTLPTLGIPGAAPRFGTPPGRALPPPSAPPGGQAPVPQEPVQQAEPAEIPSAEDVPDRAYERPGDRSN